MAIGKPTNSTLVNCIAQHFLCSLPHNFKTSADLFFYPFEHGLHIQKKQWTMCYCITKLDSSCVPRKLFLHSCMNIKNISAGRYITGPTVHIFFIHD